MTYINVTKLVLLSQRVLTAQPPFSDSILLHSFVSYKPSQGGPNRMGTLDNELIIRKTCAEKLDQRIYPITHMAYQESIRRSSSRFVVR